MGFILRQALEIQPNNWEGKTLISYSCPDSTFLVEAPISSDVGLEEKECPLPRESY
jgi:hypothetical protein